MPWLLFNETGAFLVSKMLSLFALICAAFLTVVSGTLSNDSLKSYKFPEGFKLGAASAAVQIEGAWNEDGKFLFHSAVGLHVPYIPFESRGFLPL